MLSPGPAPPPDLHRVGNAAFEAGRSPEGAHSLTPPEKEGKILLTVPFSNPGEKGGEDLPGRGRRQFLTATLLLLSLALLGSAALGAGEGGKKRKIVVFRVTDAPSQEASLAQHGLSPLKKLGIINGAVVEASEAQVRALVRDGRIARVEDDGVAYIVAETLPWGVDRIDADAAWSAHGIKGSGVRVAILDTGIDLKHPDLKANIKGGYNALNPRRAPTDGNGHGTHVAGTVAALLNGQGVIGGAPEAHLYAVKVLGDSGWGWISDIIEGIDWSVRNGMQVLNMSFGSTSPSQALQDAVARAYQAGVVMVAAAGNSGCSGDTVNYPARYPETIAVAATDQADAITSWSSCGPEVDLSAPGNQILSTYKKGTYATLSGTSMAAPHVTATAALVISRWGPLSPDQMRAHLMATADSIPQALYPRVNALSAVSQPPQ